MFDLSSVMNISVIGLGNIGLPFALFLDKHTGHNIVGMDKNKRLIEQLKTKRTNVKEPKVKELLRDTSIKFTSDFSKCTEKSEIIFIWIDTPTKDSDPVIDCDNLEQLLEQLQNFDGIIVVNSTVYPTFFEKLDLSQLHIKRARIIYNPLFISRGSVFVNLRSPDFVLFGTQQKSVDISKLTQIYIEATGNANLLIHKVSFKEAEIAKLAINSFLATKVSFANMIGTLAKESGCDNPEAILKVIGSDSRINDKFLKYGYSYGGPCIPRDIKCLINHFDKTVGVLKAVDNFNKIHIQNQASELLEGNKDVYHFDDLNYKPGVDCKEESAKMKIAEILRKHGKKVNVKK